MSDIQPPRPTVHQSVMTAEVVSALAPEPSDCLLDCTVGAGGHSRALLEGGAGRIVAIDRDRDALAVARETLAPWSERVELVHARAVEVEGVLDERGLSLIDGAIADLGVSSLQLDQAERGFSFREDGPLDMRMDRSQGPTAADLLQDVAEGALADIIYQFGEERHSRRIARRIVRARAYEPIATTAQLARLVREAVPRRGRPRIDPATRTFQALRIWVNRELDDLERFLRAVVARLRAGARFAVLTFHSLEDRIVKTVFRQLSRPEGSESALLRLLTRKPVRPTPEEVLRNRRARSAKLRTAERMA